MASSSGLSRRAFGRLIGKGMAAAALPPVLAAAPAPAAAEGIVRLSANENPYGPSPAALRAMREALGLAVAVRRFLVRLRRRLQIAGGREPLTLRLGGLRARHDVDGQGRRVRLARAVARGGHRRAQLFQRGALLRGRRLSGLFPGLSLGGATRRGGVVDPEGDEARRPQRRGQVAW